MEIDEAAKWIHDIAKEHGWWDNERPVPELLCLVHSEVSEALEAYRTKNDTNFAEELADVVIRIFDMAQGLAIDIEQEIIKKSFFNKTRPYRHGDKQC
jgi:NTP pyrophosphatase (non-canonical NTP hydrolase)